MSSKLKISVGLLAVAGMVLLWACVPQPIPSESPAATDTTADSEDGGDAGDTGPGAEGDSGTGSQPDGGDGSGAPTGAAVFTENDCDVCHGGDGSGGAGLLGPTVRCAGEAVLDAYVRFSATLHFGGAFPDLTDEELSVLAAFLSDGDCADFTGAFASHSEPKGAAGIRHRPGFADPMANCTSCHGPRLEGLGPIPSCTSCHDQLWPGAGVPSNHVVAQGEPAVLHRSGLLEPELNCTACHGDALTGVGSVPSCYSCHGPLWAGGGPPPTHTDVLTSGATSGTHAAGRDDPATNCASCHQDDLMGRYVVPACYSCHGQLWSGGGAPPTHTDTLTSGSVSGTHASGRSDPATNCASCHGADYMGTSLIPACYSCHGSLWDGPPDYPPDHTVTHGSPEVWHRSGLTDPTTNCTACHGADLTGTTLIPNCYSCHGPLWAGGGPPPTHTDTLTSGSVSGTHASGRSDPATNCASCHGADYMGTSLIPACYSCHGSLWDGPPDYPPDHTVTHGSPEVWHRSGLTDPTANCTACHGADLTGTALIPNCYSCHGPLWAGGGPPPTHTDVLTSGDVTGSHAEGRSDPPTNCASCHQDDLMGRYRVPACYSCHGQLWSGGGVPPTHTDMLTVGSITGIHATGRDDPDANCASCHGSDFFGTSLIPACWSCHGSRWDDPPDYPPSHTKRKGGSQHGAYHDPGLREPYGNCDACHGDELLGTPLIPSCYLCHGSHWGHD